MRVGGCIDVCVGVYCKCVGVLVCACVCMYAWMGELGCVLESVCAWVRAWVCE